MFTGKQQGFQNLRVRFSVQELGGETSQPLRLPNSLNPVEGQTAMHSSPQSVAVPVHSPADTVTSPRQREDRVYQAFTVAAIVLLLGSLWVF